MKNNKIFCDLEQSIMNSKRDDCLSTEQKEHIKNCSICSDSLTISNWMNEFDGISKNNSHPGQALPNPEEIWKQAFKPAYNRKELIKKAMRPLKIAQFTTYIIAFFGILFILLGKTSVLNNVFGGIAKKSNLINSLTTLFDAFSKTLPFIIVPLGIVSFLLISFFIYSLFEPENA